jgi:FMN phosphatase YigB (HAD superfamily)
MSDPDKYIEEQPELNKLLTSLKKCGKKLFLTTNSHALYMEIVMSATLGDDWMDLFDICVANCKKPLW